MKSSDALHELERKLEEKVRKEFSQEMEIELKRKQKVMKT